MKELDGNPGKRPLNEREPKPTPGAGNCPTWLGKQAKAEWRRIVPELDRLGLLTIVDRAALAAYCQAYAELIETTEIIEKEGRLIQEPIASRNRNTGEVTILGHKQKAHPAMALQRNAFNRVKQFLAEFGLTPASRSRLSVPEANDDNPLNKLRLMAQGEE